MILKQVWSALSCHCRLLSMVCQMVGIYKTSQEDAVYCFHTTTDEYSWYLALIHDHTTTYEYLWSFHASTYEYLINQIVWVPHLAESSLAAKAMTLRQGSGDSCLTCDRLVERWCQPVPGSWLGASGPVLCHDEDPVGLCWLGHPSGLWLRYTPFTAYHCFSSSRHRYRYR